MEFQLTPPETHPKTFGGRMWGEKKKRNELSTPLHVNVVKYICIFKKEKEKSQQDTSQC